MTKNSNEVKRDMTNVEYISKYEIKNQQWREAANLIAEAIPNTVISKLGTKFNRIFYESIAENQYSCAYAAHGQSGKLLGIIIGTTDRPHVYSAAIKNNLFRLILATNLRLLRPAVVGYLAKGILGKFGHKNSQSTYSRPVAELLVIAVQPQARGSRIAAALLERMEEFMKMAHLEGPYVILTEKTNERANKFYEKIAARFVGTTLHHGREINEWHKYLT